METLGRHSAIILNRYGTEKKDKSNRVWIDLKRTPQYKAGKRERYRIELKEAQPTPPAALLDLASGQTETP